MGRGSSYEGGQCEEEIFDRPEGRVRAHIREALEEGVPVVGSRLAAKYGMAKGFVLLTASGAVSGIVQL